MRHETAATALRNLGGLFGHAFGNNIHVAVGTAGTIWTSRDGKDWTRQNSGTSEWLNDVAFGGGQFVVIGPNGVVLTSPDGVPWRPQRNGVTGFFHAIAYGNGLFVAIQGAGAALTSNDGVTWNKRDVGKGVALYDATFGNDGVVLVGANETILQSARFQDQISPLLLSPSLDSDFDHDG